MAPVNPATKAREAELAARLRIAVVPLARQLRQRAGDDISPSQLSVLGTVARRGPLSLGDLAGRERLSPPMISKIVDLLVERRLVRRHGSPTDRRVTFVELTPAGRRWLDQARARRDAWLADRLATLPRHELTQLESLVPLLDALIETEP
jgi:DNA-binding MarR family transcriptional regulator